MPIESGQYITDLNETFPLSGDSYGQTDDHLRLIKAILKATFPNLNAPITATPATLNTPVPVGGIIMWYDTVQTIPAGWGLCNGAQYDKLDGSGRIQSPDLRDKFILAAGTNAPGTQGGSTSKTTGVGGGHTPAGTLANAGGHTPTGTISGTALTTAHMPTTVPINSFATGISVSAGAENFYHTPQNPPGGNSFGGGATHTHTFTGDAVAAHTHTFTGTAVADHTHDITDARPPFYALAYIIRL